MAAAPSTHRDRLVRFAGRTAALGVAWVAISEADIGSLVVGVPLVLAGAAVSLVLAPRPLNLVSLPGLVRFTIFFAVQSFLGGTDVARRALHPRMPLDPSCMWYPLRLADEGQRVMFANTLSLLPGTLSARFDGDRLEIHVLDKQSSTVASVARVEDRVADLFGQVLPPLEVGR